MLIVVSKVKALAKDKDKRMGKEALEALDGIITRKVKKAAKRANEEGVETIKARHIDPKLDA